jgi:hypothetical protein
VAVASLLLPNPSLRPGRLLLFAIDHKLDYFVTQFIGVDSCPALSENWITLACQGREAFGQLDDFSWQMPLSGNGR